MATNQTPQQPVTPPAGDPNTQYGPAPVDPNTQYQQQPVNQQYFAQPQAAPVHYVVMAESLKGVKGWLLFFVICFGLAGLSYTASFFASMTDLGSATNIIMLIFSPILAALSIASAITISMEKVIGKWLAVSTYGVAALFGVISAIVSFAVIGNGSVPALISGIFVMLIADALIATYFFASRRVKETLIK